LAFKINISKLNGGLYLPKPEFSSHGKSYFTKSSTIKPLDLTLIRPCKEIFPEKCYTLYPLQANVFPLLLFVAFLIFPASSALINSPFLKADVKVKVGSLIQPKGNKLGPNYIYHGRPHSPRANSIEYKNHLKNLAKGLGLRVHVYGGQKPAAGTSNLIGGWNHDDNYHHDKHHFHLSEDNPKSNSITYEDKLRHSLRNDKLRSTEEPNKFFRQSKIQIINGSPTDFHSNEHNYDQARPMPISHDQLERTRPHYKVKVRKDTFQYHPTDHSTEEFPTTIGSTNSNRDLSSFEVYRQKYRERDRHEHKDRNYAGRSRGQSTFTHEDEGRLNEKRFRGIPKGPRYHHDHHHHHSRRKIPPASSHYPISSDEYFASKGDSHYHYYPKTSNPTEAVGTSPNNYPDKRDSRDFVSEPDTSPIIIGKEEVSNAGEADFSGYHSTQRINKARLQKHTSRGNSDEYPREYSDARGYAAQDTEIQQYHKIRDTSVFKYDPSRSKDSRIKHFHKSNSINQAGRSHHHHNGDVSPLSSYKYDSSSMFKTPKFMANEVAQRNDYESGQDGYHLPPNYSRARLPLNVDDNRQVGPSGSGSSQRFTSLKEEDDPSHYDIVFTHNYLLSPPQTLFRSTVDEKEMKIPSEMKLNISSTPIQHEEPAETLSSSQWIGIHSSDALMERTTISATELSSGVSLPTPTPTTTPTTTTTSTLILTTATETDTNISSSSGFQQKGSNNTSSYINIGTFATSGSTTVGHEMKLGQVLDN
jgi:hypothetical protein